MKKALLVTRVSGFVPQFEMNNVKILQEFGYEVHYAADYNTIVYGNDNSRLDGTGIVRHQIDFVRSPFSKEVKVSIQQLEKLMLEEKFDLIHCHMPMSGVVARKAAWNVYKKTGRKVPVLYTAHGFHFYSGAPLKNWVYYPIERFFSRYTDRLILINEEDYNRAKKFPVRGSVERIMGVGMNLGKFEGYEKQSYQVASEELYDGETDIRKKYGIGKESIVLITVGEFAPDKNHMVMIEAMRELKDLDIVYIICGEGRMEEELRNKVKEYSLEKNVIFAGYIKEVYKVLRQTDCFVFPSRREGMPVAVMEAMSVGLPVIASGIRGINELIDHTKGGYLVDGFEPVDYAVKIRRIFTEKDGKSAVPREKRRREMGEWNRERIKQFALPIVDKKMREIYKSLE